MADDFYRLKRHVGVNAGFLYIGENRLLRISVRIYDGRLLVSFRQYAGRDPDLSSCSSTAFTIPSDKWEGFKTVIQKADELVKGGRGLNPYN